MTLILLPPGHQQHNLNLQKGQSGDGGPREKEEEVRTIWIEYLSLVGDLLDL